MFAPLVVTVIAYTHVYASPVDASSFAGRWRPQLAAGNIVSVTNLDMYVRARIALQDPRCAGAVIQCAEDGRSCMYMLHRDNYDCLHITCILWHPSKKMLRDMRALRQWYDTRFPDELYGHTLCIDEEREMWDLTAYDA